MRRLPVAARAAVSMAVLLAALIAAPTVRGAGPTLLVFAASDLAFALEEVARRFEATRGADVTLVFGSTGTLARQIENGAPADLFFAADVGFVERLVTVGAVRAETQTLYARGRLVLATPSAAGPPLASLADLRRPSVRRIAIANPEHAPYGRAAREALEAASLWAVLRPKLVYGESVRQTLQYLEAGAVDAAILGESVARVPGVVWSPVDPKLYRPLDQAAAVTTRSRQPALAGAFLAFVTGPDGREILGRYGFAAPGGS